MPGEAQAIDIKFDGYCDGMHLRLTAGYLWGHQTGCVSDPVIGPFQGNAYIVVADSTQPGILFLFDIDLDGTFFIAATDGANIFAVNQGTWSFGTPSKGAGGPSYLP